MNTKLSKKSRELFENYIVAYAEDGIYDIEEFDNEVYICLLQFPKEEKKLARSLCAKIRAIGIKIEKLGKKHNSKIEELRNNLDEILNSTRPD